MKKKSDPNQRSLFDSDEPEAPIQPAGWQEVPQAVYFSWSDARQLEYCARRDEDAARHAEGAMKEFYEERARCYRGLII